jgi:hypothetical protein
MPIRPEEKARYPADWPQISLRIRERAGWQCEFCGVEHGALGAWFSGTWWRAGPKGTGLRDTPRRGEVFPCYPPAEGSDLPIWIRLRQVVLTVAHLDHTPENCADENLKALCQRCHLAYDAKHHAKNAARTRRLKSPQADLFDRAGARP